MSDIIRKKLVTDQMQEIADKFGQEYEGKEDTRLDKLLGMNDELALDTLKRTMGLPYMLLIADPSTLKTMVNCTLKFSDCKQILEELLNEINAKLDKR